MINSFVWWEFEFILVFENVGKVMIFLWELDLRIDVFCLSLELVIILR
jgi:hypothetical protein